MPFNGSGAFQRLHSWVNDATAGIKIRADRHDQEDDNIAAGLSQTITRDGQSVITQNIPFNGKRIVNLGDPVGDQDAATKKFASSIFSFAKALNLTGATPVSPAGPPEARIAFTEADLALMARKAIADDPGTTSVDETTPDRIVFNSKADGTGTDIFVLTRDGKLTVTDIFVSGSNKEFASMPPGIILDFGGVIAPPGTRWCAGQTLVRATYPKLFDALSFMATGDITSGSTVINNLSISPMALGLVNGHAIEGPGIPLDATITAAYTATSITMNKVATATQVGAKIRLLPNGGLGDRSTTFVLPDTRGRVLAGRDNMNGNNAGRLDIAGAVNGLQLGAGGGLYYHYLTAAEMPNHNHPISVSVGVSYYRSNFSEGRAGGGFNTAGSEYYTAAGVTASGSAGYTGGSNWHDNVQPTLIANKLITTGGVI